MVLAVFADDSQKEEFLSKKTDGSVEILWADSIRSLGIIEADAYFDLQFENDPERIARLRNLLPGPVFVNSVIYTNKLTGAPFIRINAWPGLLKSGVTELVVPSPEIEEKVEDIFSSLGWKYQLVPDTTGMVTPRILAMIINEAFYALGEGISTRQEIDTAMKLGTNYPYGPFEWAQKIGVGRIKDLLAELGRTDARYAIAPALMTEQS